jgi:hypothetical protein
VRFIIPSISRSQTQLNAPPEADASAPPSSVHSVKSSGGMPRSAISIAAYVVMSSSTMMRGLVSSR